MSWFEDSPDEGRSTADPTKVAGRPQILAPVAGEWDEQHETDSLVERNRSSGPLLFLIAAIGVALVALVAAAWVAFGGSDDGSDETADPGVSGLTADSDPAATADDAASTLEQPAEDPAQPETTVAAAPAVAEPVSDGLFITFIENPFTCDGQKRPFGQLSGADPDEQIDFDSPQSDGIRSGVADPGGQATVNWQCSASQAGTTWDITATGAISGRSVSFQLVTPAQGGDLQVALTENPFLCDSQTRVFGTITGAGPDESIDFTSPDTDGIRSGLADGTGTLDIRWQCDPADAGRTWRLTATGASTGRTATFEFTGG